MVLKPLFFSYIKRIKVEVIRLANTFSKRVYYIEGLNIMVGEVDSIEKYNEMMSIGLVYDSLEDSVKAVLKKIDLYTETNEAMIEEFKYELGMTQNEYDEIFNEKEGN